MTVQFSNRPTQAALRVRPHGPPVSTPNTSLRSVQYTSHGIHMLIVRLGVRLEHVLGGKDRRLQVLVCAADPKHPRRVCRTPPDTLDGLQDRRAPREPGMCASNGWAEF